jgi:SSS family solute:Na+ symporter
MTDFVQMIVIGLGLLAIAWFAADLAGGAGQGGGIRCTRGKVPVLSPGWRRSKSGRSSSLSAITMMLGSIPQQDVFQRVMSSNSPATARKGPVIGGVLYLLFAFIPDVCRDGSAVLVMPETAQTLLKDDPQKVLPTLVMERMPLVLQIAFFGALLSAIMSTASATLLAPSTTFVENILRNLRPGMSDAMTLKAMRVSVLVFTGCVLTYAITMQGTSIYEMVSGAYQVPLVGAFVPLVFGLYWKRATTQGALLAVTMGLGVWLLFVASPIALGGLPAATRWGCWLHWWVCWAGSLAAAVGLTDHKGHVTPLRGQRRGVNSRAVTVQPMVAGLRLDRWMGRL